MDFPARSSFIKSMEHAGNMLHANGSLHYVSSLLMSAIKRSVQQKRKHGPAKACQDKYKMRLLKYKIKDLTKTKNTTDRFFKKQT